MLKLWNVYTMSSFQAIYQGIWFPFIQKNPKGLTYNFNGEEQDLVSLFLIFLQKTLKLTEKGKSSDSLKLLRLIGSLLFFFPVESKMSECKVFIQKVLEIYKGLNKKELLNLEYTELLALICFGLHVYTEYLGEDKEGQIEEEESYLQKLIAQLKEENKDFEMVLEGLTLKIINAGEEKLTEIYEIICRILNIHDPEGAGQETVCDKFTRKLLVFRTSRLIGPALIASLQEKINNDGQRKYPSFWRDNLLLEIARMNRDTVNAIGGSSKYQIYFDFMLNVSQPYRDYEYKILQRILIFDFGSTRKDENLILKKMHQIILTEDFFRHIHMNLFLIYYTLRMADLYKKNNVDQDFQNIYFSKILRIPIPAYIRLFEEINRKEMFSGREARTQKKFQEELNLLLLKYFEFFYLPFLQTQTRFFQI